jgi:hypothetical protein
VKPGATNVSKFASTWLRSPKESVLLVPSVIMARLTGD